MPSRLKKTGIIFLLVLVSFFVGLWAYVEIVFPQEKRVAFVEKKLSDFLLSQVSVQSVSFWPLGNISLHTVSVGKGKKKVIAQKISFAIKLLPLFKKEINIGSVKVHGLGLKLAHAKLPLRIENFIPINQDLTNQDLTKEKKLKEASTTKNTNNPLKFYIPKSISCIDCSIVLENKKLQRIFLGQRAFLFQLYFTAHKKKNYEINVSLSSSIINTPEKKQKNPLEITAEIFLQDRTTKKSLAKKFKNLFRLKSIKNATVKFKGLKHDFLPKQLSKSAVYSGQFQITPFENLQTENKWKISQLKIHDLEDRISANAQGHVKYKGELFDASFNRFHVQYQKTNIAQVKKIVFGKSGLVSLKANVSMKMKILQSIFPRLPNSGEIKGYISIANKKISAANIKVSMHGKKIQSQVFLPAFSKNASIKNSVLSPFVIPIEVYKNRGKVKIYGNISSLQKLQAQVHFPNFIFSFDNLSTPKAHGKPKKTTAKKTSQSRAGFSLPPIMISAGTVTISNIAQLQNFSGKLIVKNSQMQIQNAAFHAGSGILKGNWSRSDGQHKLVLHGENINPSKIANFPIKTWYGKMQLSLKAGFNEKKISETINGTIQVTSGRGRLVNSLLQKGFLSGPLGGLESRISDLEYTGFRLSLNMQKGVGNIKEAIFTSNDWSLRFLGALGFAKPSDLMATLSLSTDSVGEIPHPLYSLLEERKRLARYILNFSCHGNWKTASCWKLQ